RQTANPDPAASAEDGHMGDADGVRRRRSLGSGAGDVGTQQPGHHRPDRRGRCIRDPARAGDDVPGRGRDRRSSGDLMTAGRRLRVTVWNEYVHERGEESVKRIYPDGMHRPIADGIRRELGDGVSVRIATLEEPEHGLTEEAL